MSDQTEHIRRQMISEINVNSGSREALAEEHGQVWDTDQLRQAANIVDITADNTVARERALLNVDVTACQGYSIVDGQRPVAGLGQRLAHQVERPVKGEARASGARRWRCTTGETVGRRISRPPMRSMS